MRVWPATSSRDSFFCSRAALSRSPTDEVWMMSSSSFSAIRSNPKFYPPVEVVAGPVNRRSGRLSADRNLVPPRPFGKRLAHVRWGLFEQLLDPAPDAARIERKDHRLDG